MFVTDTAYSLGSLHGRRRWRVMRDGGGIWLSAYAMD